MQTYRVDASFVDEEGRESVDHFEALTYVEILELYAVFGILKVDPIDIVVYDNHGDQQSIQEFIFSNSYMKRIMKQKAHAFNQQANACKRGLN